MNEGFFYIVVAWPSAILVTGVLAIVGLGQRRFFVLLFLGALLSMPALFAAAYFQKQWRQQDNLSVQDHEKSLATDMCDAAQAAPSRVRLLGKDEPVAVVIRPVAGDAFDVSPVRAGHIARAFRDRPSLCKSSRVRGVRDELPASGSIASSMPYVPETFEVCRDQPGATAEGKAPHEFVLSFSMEKKVLLSGATTGMDPRALALRQFNLRLTDTADGRATSDATAFTGPPWQHIQQLACFATAGRTADFLAETFRTR